MARTANFVGPQRLTTTYTTDLVGLSASDPIFDVIERIHVVNTTGAPATFRLYLGDTGANDPGTELFFDKVVPANDVYDWHGSFQMGPGQSLVGGASAADTLTMLITGTIYSVE